MGTLVLGGVSGFIVSVATILASGHAINGSAVITGNVILPTGNNSAPSIVVDSGAVFTPLSAPLNASGNTMAARISVPSSYLSGSLLRSYSVECNGKPLATTGSLVTYNTDAVGSKPALSTAAVTKVRNFISVSSGSSVYSATGSVKLAKSTGVLAFITNTGTVLKVNGDCKLFAEVKEKYGR